jgi:hypothetical protein
VAITRETRSSPVLARRDRADHHGAAVLDYAVSLASLCAEHHTRLLTALVANASGFYNLAMARGTSVRRRVPVVWAGGRRGQSSGVPTRGSAPEWWRTLRRIAYNAGHERGVTDGRLGLAVCSTEDAQGNGTMTATINGIAWRASKVTGTRTETTISIGVRARHSRCSRSMAQVWSGLGRIRSPTTSLPRPRLVSAVVDAQSPTITEAPRPLRSERPEPQIRSNLPGRESVRVSGTLVSTRSVPIDI